MAGNNPFRDRAKTLWIKGMKAIGNTAASIASNTRYKVDEVTLQNRRREVLGDLASKAYSLWLKGEKMPPQMIKMLEELRQLDEQLNDMRAEKYASSRKQPDSAGILPADEAAEEETEEDISISCDISSPACSEINGLFDNSVSIGKMADKVNSTLDQMSDRIRRFPQDHDDVKAE